MPETTTRRTLTVAAALAAAVAAGIFAYDHRWQQGIRELEEEASSRLELASATVFAPTEKFGYLPALLASHPVVIDTLRSPRDAGRAAKANVTLEEINRDANAAVVYLLDRDGRTVASSNWHQKDSFVGHDYAFRPYFRDAIAKGKATFYGIGTTSLLPGYYVAQAVRDGGRTLGVAVVKVDMTQLDAEWRRHDDEIAVTDENGIIFLSTRPDWKYRPIRPLDAEAMDKIKRTRQYGARLKPPLSLTLLRQLHEREAVVAMRLETGSEARFFLRSEGIAGADWNINILIPLSEVEGRATRIGLIVSSAFGLAVMTLLFLRQARARAVEREKSRRDLELAHEALEEKHRELQKASVELRAASITDPLTGAYNRRYFFDSLPKIVSAAERHRFPLSIVTIDVDHFKRINDMYGHPAGDKVLQTLTALCKESLREADVFSRFGGEEFIMALPNTDADAAGCVAERLRAKVESHPVDIRDKPYGITVSCGVSQYREGEGGIEPALKRADEALYMAKEKGRNRVVVQ